MKPTLIMSYFFGRQRDKNHKPGINEDMSVWVQRIAEFESHGIDLMILGPGEIPPEAWRIREVKDSCEKNYIGIIPSNDSAEAEKAWMQSVIWVKDNFQQFGDIVFISNEGYESVHSMQILHHLGIDADIRQSPMGEGGLSIRLGKNIFFSGACRSYREDDFMALESQGYHGKIISAVSPLEAEVHPAQKLAKRMGYNGHVDTELNVATNKNGESLLLVSLEYATAFPNTVWALAELTGNHPVHILGDNETRRKSINFRPLPFGKAAVDSSSTVVKSCLEDFLGRDNVIKIRRLDPSDSYSGGIMCCSNLLYNP
jgi:hypothetical protein